jgi:hypothetical protein
VTYTLNDPNYSLAGETLLADITAKALAISGTTVASKAYDGTTTATVTPGTLTGMVEGDASPLVTATASFESASSGSGRSVSVTYTLSDPNYFLAGQTLEKAADITVAVTIPAGAASGPMPTATALVDRILPPAFVIGTAAPVTSISATSAPVNVVSAPLAVTTLFPNASALSILSSPSGQEATAPVTLQQARLMLGLGDAQGAQRDVRVPVSRNSLAEIVNGGVRLPGGVDQQLFVVEK